MMSDQALYLGICAALAAAYSLLGNSLVRVFGVDASRMTPAQRQGKRGAAVLICAYMVVCVVIGLCLGREAAAKLNRMPALVFLVLEGVYMLAPLHMAALFIGVRQDGKGLGAVAQMLLGWNGRRAVLLMAALTCALLIAKPAAWLPGLSLAQTLMLFDLVAPRIGNEAHIRPVAFGGAMVTTAAACAGAMGFTEQLSADLSIILMAMMMLCAYGLLFAEGCTATVRLFEREVQLRKMRALQKGIPIAAWLAVCAAAACVPVNLTAAALIAGLLMSVLSLGICAAWLHGMGRSCAWMIAALVWLAAGCAMLLYI